jgi:DNA (cytosine-5)-methyltransferase 1
LAPNQIAPTITTNPDDLIHYSEPRTLTVREVARLQSFPDWFEFKGRYTTGGLRRREDCPRYTQVGNAVPPLLAEAIGGFLINMLKEMVNNLNG